MTALPWIEKVEAALQDLQEIPLWGAPPPFPWLALSEYLSERISQPIKIEFHKTQFFTSEELLSGMGSRPVVLSYEISPLPETGFWVFGADDVAKVASLLLPSPSNKGFSDARLQEGFYRYLCLEAIDIINELGSFEDLNVKMADPASLPKEGALGIDVLIAIGDKKLWARAICPSSFHASFKSHFAQKRTSLAASAIAAKTEIPLSLEVGNVQLKLEDWKKVKVGDFIRLDKSSFDPKHHKGTITLVLNKTPLFQAKCKDGQLKILDYAFYYEEEVAMDIPPFDHEPGKEEDEEEKEEELSEEEQIFNEEMFLDKELEQEIAKPEEEQPLWAENKEPMGSVEKILATEEIPLTLTVEIGKLQMTVEKVLQLEPGNVLELPVKPEQGVSIMAGGKKIAQGELVMVGEALGVKILQLGSK